jgi:AAA domain
MMPTNSSENHNGVVVSNSEFLRHLLAAAPKGSSVWVNAFIGNPNGAEASWGGKAYNAAMMAAEVDGWSRQNTYFSVGAVTYAKDGSLHRRKSHFSRLLALVADDVDPDDLLATPSWGIQTSPGKRQIGILLDGQDPDCANLDLVSRLVTVMAEKGHIKADLSGNNAVRYVRLPVGQNQKPRDSGPFAHVVEYWNPTIRYTLEDAAAAFGINLDEIRNQKLTVNERVTLHQGEQDERLQVLTANILRGENLHDSLNIMAASLVASGTKGGAVVNILRALMTASQAARDDRWKSRYDDIPRSVSTAQEKFRLEPPMIPAIDPETGELIQPERKRLFTPVGKLLKELKSVNWLVRNYLEMDALSMVYGPSGSGKSFVVVDIACAVATGTGWNGLQVKQGAVFYIAGEGHNGLARRFAAWEKKTGISLEKAPLYKSDRAISLLDPNAADAVREEIERMINETGVIPVLIIIDTLARNFGQGDENKQADANKFIEHLDTYIRRPHGCNAMIVHHSGHEMDRARGSSVFKAAMDQEFWVRGQNGMIEMTVTKMKDAEMPVPKRFRIKQIGLGVMDEADVEITGAYLEVDGDPLDFEVVKHGKKVIKAIDVVRLMYKEWPGAEVMSVELGVSKRTIATVMKQLSDAGLAAKAGGQTSKWELTEKTLSYFSLTGNELLMNADERRGEG